jgi:IS5 family transposase
MAQERFVETGGDTFFGEYLYDQVIPKDHFLRKLKDEIDWELFTKKLIKLYKGQGQYGRPPFDPALVLKMSVVAYLYDLSERQVEVYVNENLPAKYFVGLAVDQKAPDHSTLTAFRRRLLKRGKLTIFEQMLDEIVRIAQEKGVTFGSIQIVDSVHSAAHANPDKEENRRRKGKEPHDPDARWAAKHSRKVKKENGEIEKQIKYFYGYKAHVSLNAETGLITTVQATAGDVYDGHHFTPLVDHDLEQGLVVSTYTADKGYDDGNNHYYLEHHKLKSAIRLKNKRTEKKDANKDVWFQLKDTPEYQDGLRERYKIERKFGEAKQWHGLGRCRYVGITNFTIQVILTAMVLNLKRLIKILTGVGFKTAGTVSIA